MRCQLPVVLGAFYAMNCVYAGQFIPNDDEALVLIGYKDKLFTAAPYDGCPSMPSGPYHGVLFGGGDSDSYKTGISLPDTDGARPFVVEVAQGNHDWSKSYAYYQKSSAAADQWQRHDVKRVSFTDGSYTCQPGCNAACVAYGDFNSEARVLATYAKQGNQVTWSPPA